MESFKQLSGFFNRPAISPANQNGSMNNANAIQTLSIRPIVLPTSMRMIDLHISVTVPVSGDKLPILLLSHGHGRSNYLSSFHGYGPLVDRFAAAGFVVIQPTHLDSATLPYRDSDHPDAPLFWKSRANDMSLILDQIDAIERATPTLAGRIDTTKVAVLGHSMGGHTASVLLGAQHVEAEDTVSVAEPRIRAGVLLAAPGRGDALSDLAAKAYPFFSTIDFSTMTTPALVVAGDKDGSAHLTTAGETWHMDPYTLAPAPKSLLTLFGAEHGLGGIAGYDAAETTDENPDRVEALASLVEAYLRSQLDPEDDAWQRTRDAFIGAQAPLGAIVSK